MQLYFSYRVVRSGPFISYYCTSRWNSIYWTEMERTRRFPIFAAFCTQTRINSSMQYIFHITFSNGQRELSLHFSWRELDVFPFLQHFVLKQQQHQRDIFSIYSIKCTWFDFFWKMRLKLVFFRVTLRYLLYKVYRHTIGYIYKVIFL